MLLRFKRFVALFFGCISCLVAGLAISIPIFINAIKDTFFLSQTEVEFLSATFQLGAGIVIIPGIISDKFGHTRTNVIGSFLLCVGFALVISSCYLTQFYSKNTALLMLFFFLMGHGTSYLYLTAMTVNMNNFASRHRGKIMMILDIFYSCSPLIYAPLYYLFFRYNVSSSSTKVTNLSNYLWFLFGISIVAILGSTVFMFNVSYENEAEDEVPLKMDDINDEATQITPLKIDDSNCGICDEDAQLHSTNFFHHFKTVDFQLIMWSNCIIGAVCNVILSNLTAITRSMSIEKYEITIFISSAGVGLLAHLVLGPISDTLMFRRSRSSVFFVTNVALFFGLCLLVFMVPNSFTVFILICAESMAQMAQAGLNFAYVMFSEHYSSNCLGKLIGVTLVLQNALGMFLQFIFGLMYDIESQKHRMNMNNSSLTCYGSHCFQKGLYLDVVVTFVALLLNVWYIVKINKASNQESLACQK